MLTLTPEAISPDIIRLCNQIAPRSTPLYVDIVPDARAEINECFPAVEKRVQEAGGDIIYGWQIWQYFDLFIDAEFHAVWRSPADTLVDITPKPHPAHRILFLHDPDRRYEGKQVECISLTLSETPIVKAFLKARSDEHEFLNRGERAFQHGLALSGEDAEEGKRLVAYKMALEMQMFRPYFQRMPSQPVGAIPTPGRNDPCHCGSGKKFKKCHGA